MSDDEQPGDQGAQEEEDLQPVPYGEFLNLVPMPPTLKEQLQVNDNQRAFSLNFLAGPYIPGAEVALDAMLSDAQQLTDATEAIGDTPQQEFARRMLHDLNDAIEAMLTLRAAPVMDACRDLMELAMLFRDFHDEPHRLPAWVKADADKRRRRFSFRFLVDKYRDDVPYLGSGDPDELLREYQAHSRTLHPAMYFTQPEELTRGRGDDPSEGFAIWTLAAHTTEITRHGAAALLMFAMWLVKEHPKHKSLESLDLEVAKEENSAINRWFAEWETMKIQGTKEEKAAYNSLLDIDRPLRKTPKGTAE